MTAKKVRGMSVIEVTSVDGVDYFETVRRGVKYMTWKGPYGWEMSTHRLALGRGNIGGFKRFDTLAEVSENVQAFRNLPQLLEQQGSVQ